MPCYDGRDDPNAMAAVRAEAAQHETEKRLRKVEAMLCGVLTAAKTTGLLDSIMIGYSEPRAGIETSDVMAWFAEHEEADMETYAAQRGKSKKVA
jgi:hypothetical protein